MKHLIPNPFKDLTELQNYTKCLLSINPGDSVELYLNGYGDVCHFRTNSSYQYEVIAVAKSPHDDPDFYKPWGRYIVRAQDGTEIPELRSQIPLIIVGGKGPSFDIHTEWAYSIHKHITNRRGHTTSLPILAGSYLIKRIIKKQ